MEALLKALLAAYHSKLLAQIDLELATKSDDPLAEEMAIKLCDLWSERVSDLEMRWCSCKQAGRARGSPAPRSLLQGPSCREGEALTAATRCSKSARSKGWARTCHWAVMLW